MLVIIVALGYFAWRQLAVASALVAGGIEVWWSSRQPGALLTGVMRRAAGLSEATRHRTESGLV